MSDIQNEYVRSKNIKVYPTAYRGSAVNGQETYFDPESNYNTENAITRLYRLLMTDKGSFVITDKIDFTKTEEEEYQNFEFLLGGYYFKIINALEVFDNTKTYYAHIKTSSFGYKEPTKSTDTDGYDVNNTEYTSPILVRLNNSLNASVENNSLDDDNIWFKGLIINESESNTDYTYTLCLLKAGVVPEGSKPRFDGNYICTKTIDGVKYLLNEYLETETFKSKTAEVTDSVSTDKIIANTISDSTNTIKIEFDKTNGKLSLFNGTNKIDLTTDKFDLTTDKVNLTTDSISTNSKKCDFSNLDEINFKTNYKFDLSEGADSILTITTPSDNINFGTTDNPLKNVYINNLDVQTAKIHNNKLYALDMSSDSTIFDFNRQGNAKLSVNKLDDNAVIFSINNLGDTSKNTSLEDKCTPRVVSLNSEFDFRKSDSTEANYVRYEMDSYNKTEMRTDYSPTTDFSTSACYSRYGIALHDGDVNEKFINANAYMYLTVKHTYLAQDSKLLDTTAEPYQPYHFEDDSNDNSTYMWYFYTPKFLKNDGLIIQSGLLNVNEAKQQGDKGDADYVKNVYAGVPIPIRVANGRRYTRKDETDPGITEEYIDYDNIITLLDEEGNSSGFKKLTCQLLNESSDKRLKKNIKAYEPDNSILDLPVKEFDFIDTNLHTIGCIAQDLQELFPELVSKDSKGYLTIQETKLLYLLLLELKKMRKELDELKK